MSRIAVVVNPTSGRGRGKPIGERTIGTLRERGHEVLDLTRPTASAARAVARNTVAHGVDALVVVGGDGIVNLGANVVAQTDVPLGIVASGTGNDIARALGLPLHDVPRSLDVIERAMTAEPRFIDLVRVGPPEHAAATWFVGVLSCGIDAAVNARANRMSWPRGPLKYWAAIVPELLRFKPYGYRVTTDDAEWVSSGTLVAVGSSSRFGGGFQITPHARLDNGVLHVLVASALSRRGIAQVLPLVKAGRHLGHPACQLIETTAVTIEPDSRLGGLPPHAFADGEHVGPLPLRAEVHPGILRVLAGGGP